MKMNLFSSLLALIYLLFILCVLFFAYLLIGDNLPKFTSPPTVTSENNRSTNNKSKTALEVVDGIHVQTGLVYAEGFDIVRGTCTACHSAKLVTQNRATREGWAHMIDWMQETQGLWDLGKNEAIILDYLAKHYAPKAVGRRANLDLEAVKWYVLELKE